MSILENIVSQITSNATGSISKPQSFDLSDDTFANLLKKASEVSPLEEQNDMFSNLGVPAGFEIEPLDAPQEIQKIEFNPQDFEMKDLNLSDNYFSNLLNGNLNAMNLAKRQATNAYNIFEKNFVDTLEEFVADSASILK